MLLSLVFGLVICLWPLFVGLLLCLLAFSCFCLWLSAVVCCGLVLVLVGLRLLYDLVVCGVDSCFSLFVI